MSDRPPVGMLGAAGQKVVKMSIDSIDDVTAAIATLEGENRSLAERLSQSEAQRTRLEATLKESEAYNRLVFQDASNPIVIIDPVAGIVDCNLAAAHMYGHASREDVLGKMPLAFSAPTQYDGTDSQTAGERLVRSIFKQGVANFEWRAQRANGQTWDADVHLMTFDCGGKQLLRLTIDDITEQKRISDEIEAQQREIKKLLEEQQAIFENAPNAIFYTSDGIILRANKRLATHIGRTVDEVIGQSASAMMFLSPESFRAFGEAVGPELRAGRDAHVEWEFIRKDGTRFIANVSGQGVNVAGYERVAVWSFEDITQRKRLEREIRQSEEIFRRVLENSPAGVTISTEDGQPVFSNRRLTELLAIAPEKVANHRTADNWLDPADRDIFIAQLQRDGSVSDYQANFVDTDGTPLTVLLTSFLLDFVDGRHLVTWIYDITERQKLLEEQQVIFENAPNGIVYTADGIILRANRRIAEHLGRTVEGLIGQPGAIMFESPENYRAFGEIVGPLLGADKDAHVEWELARKDGTKFIALVSGQGLHIAGHQRVTVWVFEDIAERRAQDEALRASHAQIAAQAALLERQNDTLKENVLLREEVERIGRHDIKTPLNSIVAVTRLLREEHPPGPEADELLTIVERAGYRILSMVNLSLDLYKMEQGSYVFRPDAVDLVDLANKVTADVRMHAASKQVRLKVDVSAAPFAWAEELLCYSLLANLLKNALEASPEGGMVTISAEAGTAETVLLRIHNRGVVPESICGHFFEKYATRGKVSGTGLGTYSARLMARVQDGDIEMETSEPIGTTISIRLRAAPAGTVPATLRHAAERRGVEPLLISAMPPTRVLLVDDDEYNLLLVRRFLPTPPFTVDTAINGRVALGAAERQWPDVVFMDLDMPVMGGLQAVGELRTIERARLAKRCTIVALSSHDDDETRRRALAAGFDRYLTKPVTRDVIHETLLELNVLIGGAAALPVQPPTTMAVPGAAGMIDPIIIDQDVEPVLAQFMESRRQLIAGLSAAMHADNRAEVRRIAHQLAGSFALYGFLWASEQSRWIEHNFSAIEPLKLTQLAGDLRAHLATADIRFTQANP